MLSTEKQQTKGETDSLFNMICRNPSWGLSVKTGDIHLLFFYINVQFDAKSLKIFILLLFTHLLYTFSIFLVYGLSIFLFSESANN